MTPEGRLLFEARRPLADPGLQGTSRRNREASALRFGDWDYLVCGAWDEDIAPAGRDWLSGKIAHVDRMGQTAARGTALMEMIASLPTPVSGLDSPCCRVTERVTIRGGV